MEYYYIFKDGRMIARECTREEAIDTIRQKQKRETHYIKAQFTIIKGGPEEAIKYE